MPEVGEFPKYLHTVDDFLLQSSNQAGNQGCFSRCYSCGSGVKSELFNACLECQERFQDVKPGESKAPLLVQAPFVWRTDPIPLAQPIVPEDHVAAPPSNRVTRPRTTTSDNSSRDHVLILPSSRSPRSPYRTCSSQRGRPPNGSRPPPGFKGVRQRKGVRGYLVEIRPPKWKRTIWLGTYNTDREAAGAYDAGIYYTNKKTKYNFPHLEGTFPPLPLQLRLDQPSDAEEIKSFVQKEARLAAQKVKGLPLAESSATSTITTQNDPATVSTSVSSEESSEPRQTGANGPMVVIPLDDEYFENWIDWPRPDELSMLEDICSAISFPQGGNQPQATTGWLKEEILDHTLL